MNLLRRLQYLIPAFRRREEREQDAEVEALVRIAADEAVESGTRPVDAGHAARHTLGNLTLAKESVREVWGWSWLENLYSDVRFALRMMRKQPAFAGAAILSLTLGIGINAAFFCLVNALLLKPLPVPNPEQLVRIQIGAGDNPYIHLTYPLFQAIHKQGRLFSEVAGWSSTRFLLGPGINGRFVSGVSASGSYFAMLGIPAQLGRTLTEEDDQAGSPLVAVLSHDLWMREFQADPAIVGRTIHLNSTPFTVVGVMPQRFFGASVGSAPAVTISLHANDRLHPEWHILTQQNSWWLGVLARLKPEATLHQARAQMRVVSTAIMDEAFAGAEQASPARTQSFDVLPAATGGWSWWRERFSRPLLVLLAISGLLLAVSCVNVAGLLLARAEARKKEMAIRVAIGAGRVRLATQLITESVFLSATGALAGTAIAFWTCRMIVHFLAGDSSLTIDLQPDLRVVAFMIGATLLTALLFGCAPAWRASAIRPSQALKQAGIGAPRRRRHGGDILVSGQIALSVLLLMGALLFARTLRNLQNQSFGFVPENLVLIGVDADRSGMTPIGTPEDPGKGRLYQQVYQRLLEQLRSHPLVRSASLVSIDFIDGSYSTVEVAAESQPNVSRPDRVLYANRVAPDYFRTIGTRLVRGREFEEADSGSKDRVAILNESAAAKYFPMGDAIGGELRLGSDGQFRIVGIVQDAKYADLRAPAPRTVFFNCLQSKTLSSVTFVIRAHSDQAPVSAAFRSLLRAAGKDVIVSSTRTLRQSIDGALASEQLVATLAALFGALGVVLVFIGVYAQMAFSVARRTSEIGVRLALGAQRGRVLRMILRETAVIIAAGVVVGVPAAIALSRLVSAMLFGIQPGDPWLISSCAAALFAVGIAAALVPASNACQVDPMIALRHE